MARDPAVAAKAETYEFGRKTYRVHPIAAKFPPLQGTEFATMVESVRSHGVRQPILVTGPDADIIVDGRNRARAARAAGREPRFEILPDDADLLGVIVAQNFVRRHQSPSQRAVIAALIRLDALGDWLAGGDGRNDVPSDAAGPSGPDPPTGERPADDNTQARSPDGSHADESSPQSADRLFGQPSLPLAERSQGRVGARKRPTQEQMCELAGVSVAYLRDAETIVKVAPDLVDEILRGSVSVRDAHAICMKPRDARDRAVEAVRGGRAKTAKAALTAPPATAGGESPGTASPASPAAPTAADPPTTSPTPGSPGTSQPGGTTARGRRAGDVPATRSTPAPLTPDRDAGADSAPAPPAGSSPAAAGHDQQQVVEPAVAVVLRSIASGLRMALGDINAALCSECPRGSGLDVRWVPPHLGVGDVHWAACVLAVPPDDLLDAYLDKMQEELAAGRLKRAALLAPLDPERSFFDRVLDADCLRCAVLERAVERSRRSALYLFDVEQDATHDVEQYASHMDSAFGHWGHVLFPPGTGPRRGSNR